MLLCILKLSLLIFFYSAIFVMAESFVERKGWRHPIFWTFLIPLALGMVACVAFSI